MPILSPVAERVFFVDTVSDDVFTRATRYCAPLPIRPARVRRAARRCSTYLQKGDLALFYPEPASYANVLACRVVSVSAVYPRARCGGRGRSMTVELLRGAPGIHSAYTKGATIPTSGWRVSPRESRYWSRRNSCWCLKDYICIADTERQRVRRPRGGVRAES